MKTLPNTMIDLGLISAELKQLFTASKMTHRGLAVTSDLSTNTVKSILSGEPANIANYDSVCRALGSSLVKVIQGLGSSINAASTSTTTTTPDGNQSVEVVADPLVPQKKTKPVVSKPTEKKEAADTTATATFSI